STISRDILSVVSDYPRRLGLSSQSLLTIYCDCPGGSAKKPTDILAGICGRLPTVIGLILGLKQIPALQTSSFIDNLMRRPAFKARVISCSIQSPASLMATSQAELHQTKITSRSLECNRGK